MYYPSLSKDDLFNIYIDHLNNVKDMLKDYELKY